MFTLKKISTYISNAILFLLDIFYPIFKGIMPLQTYRYAACGGFNVALDISLFILMHDYILKGEILQLGFIAFKPHIASFFLSFIFTFPVGFYLSRYVVWQATDMKKRVQLFRYFIVVMGCILLNYCFLKLFIDYWHWGAALAKVVTTFFVVIFSYLAQRNYSFKVAKINL